MRIVMIGQKGIPGKSGGIETHVEALGYRLARAGADVVVYARRWYTGGERSKAPRLTVVHVPSIPSKHLDTISHVFLATLHAVFLKADVFHYHGVGPSLLAWMPRLLAPRARVVATFHCIDRHHAKWGWFARRMLALGEWAACGFAHETICVSQTLADYVALRFSRRAHYIPNGVANDASTPGDAALRAFGLAHGNYIIAVARLIPHKGMHHLVRAFQSLSPETKNGLKLVIVGDGHYTDRYVEELKATARGADILFPGALPQARLRELLAHGTALVHPSVSEGMPLAVLEAMNEGLPVLVSDIPEHRELGIASEYVFAPENPDAIKEKITHLLSQSAETRRAAGEVNRRIVRRAFDWDDIARETAALYGAAEITTMSALPSKSAS